MLLWLEEEKINNRMKFSWALTDCFSPPVSGLYQIQGPNELMFYFFSLVKYFVLEISATIPVDLQWFSRHKKFVQVTNPGRWVGVVSVKRPCFFCYG
jgi:hypothetical protein